MTELEQKIPRRDPSFGFILAKDRDNNRTPTKDYCPCKVKICKEGNSTGQ